MNCELCEKEGKVTKHHPIPKVTINKVNPKSNLLKMTINLCEYCHREVHFSFIQHLLMTHKIDGYNRFSAIQYSIIKKWLKAKNLTVWHKWKVFFKEYLDAATAEFAKEFEE